MAQHDPLLFYFRESLRQQALTDVLDLWSPHQLWFASDTARRRLKVADVKCGRCHFFVFWVFLFVTALPCSFFLIEKETLQ